MIHQGGIFHNGFLLTLFCPNWEYCWSKTWLLDSELAKIGPLSVFLLSSTRSIWQEKAKNKIKDLYCLFWFWTLFKCMWRWNRISWEGDDMLTWCGGLNEKKHPLVEKLQLNSYKLILLSTISSSWCIGHCSWGFVSCWDIFNVGKIPLDSFSE